MKFQSSPLTKERILAGVENASDTGCWLWKRSCNNYGYGYLHSHGKRHAAHKVSYELYVGEIPKGMLVCHKCDTPNCVNPEHLFLGTPADNQLDMKLKKRSTIGAKNPLAKLSEKDVASVLYMHEQGVMQKDIAVKFGVSRLAINLVVKRKNWSHVNV